MAAKRILLVDDEISSAEVLGVVLAGEGYTVTTAADGHQALARLAEAAPDLVITGLMMPMVNGAELVQALREHAQYPQYRDVPVILMSGAPESALDAYGVSYQAFLRKPFNLEQLLAAVHRLLPPPAGA